MISSTLKNLLALTLSLTAFVSFSQTVKEPAANSADWTKDYQPFRIAGNLYYVGTADLASYLITTPKGHILINTGIASSASQIKAHVEALGFRMKDIRILLTNQAHYDHVGAMAAIKKMTGAKFMADEKDAAVLRDGGVSDYYFGGSQPTFQPLKIDRLLKDKDTISLGGTKLQMLHHPGHTKGSCSYLLDVRDSARSYRVLIANMPSIIIDKKFSETTSYPGMAKDYAYTLQAMAALDFDLWVAAHGSQFDLLEKRKEGDAYNPGVFGDKENFRKHISALQEAFKEKMSKE
jgi:metallo-beta-lactamase class B